MMRNLIKSIVLVIVAVTKDVNAINKKDARDIARTNIYNDFSKVHGPKFVHLLKSKTTVEKI